MNPARTVGIVGGGQLARMMIDAAHDAGVAVRVLAGEGEDPVTDRGVPVDRGDTTDLATLERFAATVDVLTFDHELVPTATVAALESAGHRCAPSSSALQFSRKAHQRVAFGAAGVPVPPFVVVTELSDLDAALATLGFDRSLPSGIVAKASEGGYDGRGVIITSDVSEVEDLIRRCTPAAVVLEPLVDIAAELAVLIVSGADGASAQWPPIDTIQASGMCAVTMVPSSLPPPVLERASEVAALAARTVGAVGVLAVELFVTAGGEVLVNEIAPRPHNSGHITIDVSETSQFENHLRAVAGRELGPPDLTAATGVMINIVGSDPPDDHPGPPGIHLFEGDDSGSVRYHRYGYGKSPRPGRKIGHVNFWGDDAGSVRNAAARFVDVCGVEPLEQDSITRTLRSTSEPMPNRLM